MKKVLGYARIKQAPSQLVRMHIMAQIITAHYTEAPDNELRLIFETPSEHHEEFEANRTIYIIQEGMSVPEHARRFIGHVRARVLNYYIYEGPSHEMGAR